MSFRSRFISSFAAVGCTAATTHLTSGKTDSRNRFETLTNSRNQNYTPLTFTPQSLDSVAYPRTNYQTIINTPSFQNEIENCSKFLRLEREIQGFPGCSITVMKDHEVIWETGVGYSDVENGILCTPKTVMRIASISKSLTSAVIGLLIDSNELCLDDTVQTHLTNFPLLPVKKPEEKEKEKEKDKKKEKEKAGVNVQDVDNKEDRREQYEITVRQLCNHTSGIRSYKDDDEFVQSKHYNTNDKKDNRDQIDGILECFRNDDLLFIPGERFSYSTYNYSVLSAIIETILRNRNNSNSKYNRYTNRYNKENTFVSFLNENVFKPLKMYDTYADTHTQLISNRGEQYSRGDNGHLNKDERSIRGSKHELCNTVFVDNSNKFAGGGFLSTSNDIARFGDQFILQNKLISKNTLYSHILDSMRKIKVTKITEKKKEEIEIINVNYGVGWTVDRDANTDEIIEVGHSGGAVGGTSYLLIRPKENLVVALIINMEGTNPTFVAKKIADYFADSDDVNIVPRAKL